MSLHEGVLKKGLRNKGHKFFGALVTALGIFWLAHKLGWMPAHGSGQAVLWPLLLIGAGLFLFFGKRHGHNRSVE